MRLTPYCLTKIDRRPRREASIPPTTNKMPHRYNLRSKRSMAVVQQEHRYPLRSRGSVSAPQQHSNDEIAAAEALVTLKTVVLEECPVCGIVAQPADDDGHCSYECASGGGWTVSGTAEVGCHGCKTNQPNQLAHIGAGGCLGEWY